MPRPPGNCGRSACSKEEDGPLDGRMTRGELHGALLQHQEVIVDLEKRLADQIRVLGVLLSRTQLLPEVNGRSQANNSSKVVVQTSERHTEKVETQEQQRGGAPMGREELALFATEMVFMHGSIKAAFDKLDTNRNGRIGLEEFRTGLDAMGCASDADAIFHSLTKRGVMRMEEFSQLSEHVKAANSADKFVKCPYPSTCTSISASRRLSMISEKYPERMHLCLRKLQSKCGVNQSGVITDRNVASLLKGYADYAKELREPISQMLKELDSIANGSKRWSVSTTMSASLRHIGSVASGLSSWEETSVPVYKFAELLLVENVQEVFPSMDEPVVEVIAKIRQAVFEEDPAKIVISAMDLDLSDLEEEGASTFDRVLDGTMSVVILLSAVSTGLFATHKSKKWGLPMIVEVIFTTIFTAELTLRTIRHGPRKLFFKSGWRWAWFDAVMILLAIADLLAELVCTAMSCQNGGPNTSSVMGLRLFRLLRIARLARLLKLQTFRELRLLLSGIEGLTRTLLCVVALLLVTVYFLGVLMTQLLGASDEVVVTGQFELFSDVPRSMYTVFRCLMVGDCSSVDGTPILVHLSESGGWAYSVAYCTCFVVVNYGFTSLLTALVVDSTLTAAKVTDFKRSMKAAEQKKVGQSIWRLTNAFKEHQILVNRHRGNSMYASNSMFMERNSFIQVASLPAVKRLFDDLDIDDVDRLDLFDTLDSDGNGRVDVEEFVGGILKMRGDARKADVVATRLMITQLVNKFRGLEETLRSSHMEVIDAVTCGAEGMA